MPQWLGDSGRSLAGICLVSPEGQGHECGPGGWVYVPRVTQSWGQKQDTLSREESAPARFPPLSPPAATSVPMCFASFQAWVGPVFRFSGLCRFGSNSGPELLG